MVGKVQLRPLERHELKSLQDLLEPYLPENVAVSALFLNTRSVQLILAISLLDPVVIVSSEIGFSIRRP